MNSVFDLGYVKLPRDIMNRSWYKDGGVLKMYIELLLRAAFKDTVLDGVQVKKGQVAMSMSELGEICGLTVRQTRTAVSKLKATNDIAVLSTTQFSIITVNPEAKESVNDKPADTLADKRGDKQNDKPSIYIKKEKEIKEREEERIITREPAPAPEPEPEYDDIADDYEEFLRMVEALK